jgi:hypothetical protein
MTFLPEMHITYFSRQFTLFKVISRSKSYSASFKDWLLNIFSAFSLLTFPFMMTKNDKNSGPDIKNNTCNNGKNKGGIEHLTILTT